MARWRGFTAKALWVMLAALCGSSESAAQTSAEQSSQSAYSVVVAAAVDSATANETLEKVQAAGYEHFVKDPSFGPRFNVHRPKLDRLQAEALADEIRELLGFAAVRETATLDKDDWPSRAVIIPCETQGFPCTWDEVAPETVEQTDVLGEIAVLHGISGAPLESMAAFLRDQPEVASAIVSGTGVQYRLKGVRPAWAFPRDELAHHRKQDGEQSGETAEAPKPPLYPSTASNEQRGSLLDGLLGTLGTGLTPSRAFAAGPSEEQGVAADEPGKGKKALILAPFEFEFPGWGETFARRVGVIRDYQKRHDGEVVLRANVAEFEDNPPDAGDDSKRADGTRLLGGEVRFEDFLGWDDKDYSLIVIASHGTTHDCDAKAPVGGEEAAVPETVPGRQCPLIWAGRARQQSYGSYRGVEVLTFNKTLYETHPGLTRREADICAKRIKQIKEEATEVDEQAALDKLETEGGKPCRVFSGVRDTRLVGLWTPLFKQQYPDGLENVILFMGSCLSGINNILLDHFAQQDNEHVAVIGFEDVVSSYDAFDLATDMLDILLEDGFHSDELIEKLKKKDRTKHMVGRALAPGDESLPAEPAEVVDASAGPTHARDVVMLLDPDSEEELQDGDTVTVTGVPGDGAEDKLEVLPQIIGVAESDPLEEIRLSVYPVDEKQSNRRYRPDRRIRRGVHRYEDEVFLGRDSSFEERVDLEIHGDLPGGGESLWRYENIRLAGPYWTLSVSGSEASGTYSGPLATATIDRAGRVTTVAMHTDPDERPTVTINITPPTGSGYEPGSSKRLGWFEVMVSRGETDKVIQDVDELWNQWIGLVSAKEPYPPPEVTIERVTEDLVFGSVQGAFWLWREPGTDQAGTMSVKFHARACRMGEPQLSRCQMKTLRDPFR